jgi:predicted HTH domain antitoxin
MPVTLTDELLHSAKLTEAELKAELALTLFAQERLTLAQAAELASLPLLDFQRLLRDRRIPLHYDASDLEQDLQRALAKP